MNEEFKNNDIIIEMKTLVDTAEEYQDEINAYCEFMKGVFLATSGVN